MRSNEFKFFHFFQDFLSNFRLKQDGRITRRKDRQKKERKFLKQFERKQFVEPTTLYRVALTDFSLTIHSDAYVAIYFVPCLEYLSALLTVLPGNWCRSHRHRLYSLRSLSGYRPFMPRMYSASLAILLLLLPHADVVEIQKTAVFKT